MRRSKGGPKQTTITRVALARDYLGGEGAGEANTVRRSRRWRSTGFILRGDYGIPAGEKSTVLKRDGGSGEIGYRESECIGG